MSANQINQHWMYQGRAIPDHVHPDDDLPPMRVGQQALLTAAILTIIIGLGQFMHWSNTHFWQAMGLMGSGTLAALATKYGLSFVRERHLCQRCDPSTPTRL